MLTQKSQITSCYIGPQISPEQFIAEHFFLYLAKGTLHGYDGHNHYTLHPGEYCIVRKNHLARYTKIKDNDAFEKVVVVFDTPFLRLFQQRHHTSESVAPNQDAFVGLQRHALIPAFIQSLMPYYAPGGKIDETFADVKREELLLILLQSNATLASILFDFGAPEKIDLEAFMNRNYKFNVSVERFAYLTGRSLSVFKKEFASIFQETPSRWLVQRRLQEAHFLIHEQGKKPSEIYLDLGFEDLSHFSFAFKKKFGIAPTRKTA
jgi:AraC family transcriptional regulator, exoenzyme S synthesis regulatory protein ExsA